MFKILYGPYRIEDFPLSRNQRSEPWPSRSRAIGWHLDQLKFFAQAPMRAVALMESSNSSQRLEAAANPQAIAVP